MLAESGLSLPFHGTIIANRKRLCAKSRTRLRPKSKRPERTATYSAGISADRAQPTSCRIESVYPTATVTACRGDEISRRSLRAETTATRSSHRFGLPFLEHLQPLESTPSIGITRRQETVTVRQFHLRRTTPCPWLTNIDRLPST